MERLINLYKALGDPQRLTILQLLSGREMSVCEIMVELKLSQPAVSHHLKILRQYGMIEYCKQGKLVFYSLCETGLQRNTQLLTAHLGRLLSCAGLPYKPSPLRENENYCESMGLKRTFCEEDV